MTRKSRFISAIAIAASGALMITTTAYQSKAANGVLGDNYHVDEGTGYAGAKIDNVITESSGTFRYDAPGTGEDIKIVGSDITALASAVNALASQVMNVGDTAKAADMALDTGAATAIGNASEANTTALNLLKDSIGALDNNTTLSELKASIDELKTTIENKNFGGGTGGSAGGIYGEILQTPFGYVNADRSFLTYGSNVPSLFRDTIDFTGGGATTGYASAAIDRTNSFRYVVWQFVTNQVNNIITSGTKSYAKTYESAGLYAYSISNTAYFINRNGQQLSFDGNYCYIFAPLVD